MEQIDLLSISGIDLVGLWHGVPDGASNLEEEDLVLLSKVTSKKGVMEPVMVTLSHEPRKIAQVASRAGIRYVQLHSYQPPPVVRKLREYLPDSVIIKALHLINGTCPERPLLGSYTRAGTDLFLIDSASVDGRVGSTGLTTSEQEIIPVVRDMEIPFLLAGGISSENREEYQALTRHARFQGIDVDSGARGNDGNFSRERIQHLVRAWAGQRHRKGVTHERPLHGSPAVFGPSGHH